MGSTKLESISLMSIHSTAVDLIGAPPGSAVELMEHRERVQKSLIILNCPQCGRPMTIGDTMSNFNFKIKSLKVPRRITVKDRIDHICGASFSISENKLLWYNSEAK